MINQSDFLRCWIIVLRFYLVKIDICSLFKYIHKYIHASIGVLLFRMYHYVLFRMYHYELYFYLISNLILSIASYGLWKKKNKVVAFSFQLLEIWVLCLTKCNDFSRYIRQSSKVPQCYFKIIKGLEVCAHTCKVTELNEYSQIVYDNTDKKKRTIQVSFKE